MEGQLDTFNAAGFMVAQQIYSSGGHSKSFAELTLASPLSDAIPSGTIITGTDAEGRTVTGEAHEDAAAASTTLKFRYAVSSSQATYSNCHVGGLIETNTDGCMYRCTWIVLLGALPGTSFVLSQLTTILFFVAIAIE